MEDLHQLQHQFGPKKVPIIIVEDDHLLGLTLKKYLEKKFVTQVLLYATSEECLVEFAKNHEGHRPFILLADISLGQGSDGLFLIDLLTEKQFEFSSIVMTGFASIETAIAATKRGASHYLTKPFELESLGKLVLEAICKLLKLDQFDYVGADEEILSQSTPYPHTDTKPFEMFPLGQRDIFYGIVGKSKSIKEMIERVEKTAKSEANILVLGPTGTGKELVVHAIHQLSARKNGPLISMHCSAIPADILESELFGHRKGAFKSALANRKGRFELAHTGTIFLNEVAHLPLNIQAKLLKVLQSKQIEPIGCTTPIEVDVRVIAAAEEDLELAVQEGRFREDLYYRLNVIPIRVPPLRERREDIPLLISYFLKKYTSADKSNAITISIEAMDLLMGHDWSGNVRELENIIERLVVLKGGQLVTPFDLPSRLSKANPLASQQYKSLFELPETGIDLKQVLQDIEETLIRQALQRTSGNKNQASKLLSLNRTTLIEKLKKREFGHLEQISTEYRS